MGLAADVGNVGIHGADSDFELVGNDLRRRPEADEFEDFPPTSAQSEDLAQINFRISYALLYDNWN